MKLKLVKASEIDFNAKSSIHKNGKLGFSGSAIKMLALDNNCSLLVSINEDDKTDENLYISVVRDDTVEGFRVAKAGEYYYANTKALFDTIGVDYRNKTIIYDIVGFDYEGQRMFKFIKREVSKRKTRK